MSDFVISHGPESAINVMRDKSRCPTFRCFMVGTTAPNIFRVERAPMHKLGHSCQMIKTSRKLSFWILQTSQEIFQPLAFLHTSVALEIEIWSDQDQVFIIQNYCQTQCLCACVCGSESLFGKSRHLLQPISKHPACQTSPYLPDISYRICFNLYIILVVLVFWKP